MLADVMVERGVPEHLRFRQQARVRGQRSATVVDQHRAETLYIELGPACIEG